jgi:hypothetical protein
MAKIYHVKSAGKDYPELNIAKGDEFWWHREGGKEIISRTDPAAKPVDLQIDAPAKEPETEKAPARKVSTLRKTRKAPVEEVA